MLPVFLTTNLTATFLRSLALYIDAIVDVAMLARLNLKTGLRPRPLRGIDKSLKRTIGSARHYSSKVDCYISKFTDPYLNLAIEEWLLRDTDPERYILYLWRNRPCVVIGRNQNPFLECNLGFMRDHDIPLVRRRSGGGAVYHVRILDRKRET